MTTFYKSFQRLAAVTGFVTLIASPALANVAPNAVLGDRSVINLIVPFQHLQLDARSKKITPSVREAGCCTSRYASILSGYSTASTQEALAGETSVAESADIREANAIDTAEQYETARALNS